MIEHKCTLCDVIFYDDRFNHYFAICDSCRSAGGAKAFDKLWQQGEPDKPVSKDAH